MDHPQFPLLHSGAWSRVTWPHALPPANHAGQSSTFRIKLLCDIFVTHCNFVPDQCYLFSGNKFQLTPPRASPAWRGRGPLTNLVSSPLFPIANQIISLAASLSLVHQLTKAIWTHIDTSHTLLVIPQICNPPSSPHIVEVLTNVLPIVLPGSSRTCTSLVVVISCWSVVLVGVKLIFYCLLVDITAMLLLPQSALSLSSALLMSWLC